MAAPGSGVKGVFVAIVAEFFYLFATAEVFFLTAVAVVVVGLVASADVGAEDVTIAVVFLLMLKLFL